MQPDSTKEKTDIKTQYRFLNTYTKRIFLFKISNFFINIHYFYCAIIIRNREKTLYFSESSYMTQKMHKNSTSRQDDDNRLMLQVKNGDIAALGKLYTRHISNIIQYLKKIRKDDGWTEDIAHELFIRIWFKRQSFRGNSSFRTYMLGIVKNITREYYRQECKKVLFQQILRPSILLSDPEASLLLKEQIKGIEEIKLKLSEKQLCALNMCYSYKNTSSKLAAQRLGISYDSYRQRLYSARKHIKKLLLLKEK